jgi:hypothetical protein
MRLTSFLLSVCREFSGKHQKSYIVFRVSSDNLSDRVFKCKARVNLASKLGLPVRGIAKGSRIRTHVLHSEVFLPVREKENTVNTDAVTTSIISLDLSFLLRFSLLMTDLKSSRTDLFNFASLISSGEGTTLCLCSSCTVGDGGRKSIMDQLLLIR